MSSHVHLVGICGTGMASLAGLFLADGWRVTGSDTQAYPPMGPMLAELGISVAIGFDAAHLAPRPDLVIVGNVCTAQNPEARAAIDTNIPYRTLPHAVAEFFGKSRLPIVITGTHGKTTCTSLAAWLLESAGRDPSFLIGGVPHNFARSYKLGAGREIVIEGDEYDSAFFEKTPKFLHYGGRAILMGPVEFDHADIYQDLDAVLAAFRTLITQLPHDALLVACADSANVRGLLKDARCKVITYGVEAETIADVKAYIVAMGPSGAEFGIVAVRRSPVASYGKDVARDRSPVPGDVFHSPLAGKHNVQNATGVITLLRELGLAAAELKSGLATFGGIKRRQEIIGVGDGVTIIDDFAHHPTAIRETVQALRSKFPGQRLVIAFEPRSNTSGRKIFHEAYLEAFQGASFVVLGAVHKVDRIPPAERLDAAALARDLSARNIPAHYCPESFAIRAALLHAAQPGDVVAFMSNGDFAGLHHQLLQDLQQRSR